jgi:hypothetical protein
MWTEVADVAHPCRQGRTTAAAASLPRQTAAVVDQSCQASRELHPRTQPPRHDQGEKALPMRVPARVGKG